MAKRKRIRTPKATSEFIHEQVKVSSDKEAKKVTAEMVKKGWRIEANTADLVPNSRTNYNIILFVKNK